MAAIALQETLKRMRQWVVLTGGACGAGWGLLATLVFLTVMVWLDLMWELPSGARVAALLAAVGAGCVLLTITVRRALESAPATALARHLDRVAGTGGEILAGVEMAPGGEGALRVGRSPLSAGLAEIAVERAERLVSGLTRQEVAPLRPVKRSFGSAGLFALFVGLLLLAMPRLARTEWLRFSDPFGDHPPFSRVHFVVTPAGARVLYGGGLEIIAKSEGAGVDKVELVLLPSDGKGPGETLPMFPEAEGVWRASVSSIVKPAKYFVRSRGSRSYKYALDVTMVPKIEEVRFRVTPPAYTRQTSYEGELPPAGLSGLAGTTVEIMARSNRPLRGGLLSVVAGTITRGFPTLTLPTDSHQVTAAFVIENSGRMELKLTDIDGGESTEIFSAPVLRLVDEHPFVRLVEPRPVSLAVPDAVLPVVIAAEDDYGISRVQLFRSLNDSRPMPLEVSLPKLPPRQISETVSLPLNSYGLEPGDEIKLFARVEDNDPGYSPVSTWSTPAARKGKGSESAVVVIRIISQAEFDRLQVTRDGLETLMAKYQQSQRRMESLLNELDQLKKELDANKSDDPKKAEELRQKMQKLAQRIKEEADALRKLSKARQPFKIDDKLTQELEKTADALEKLSKRLQEALKDPKKREELEKQLEQLRKQLQEERERLDEESMRPLQRLQQVFPLMEAEARFGQLAQRQRDLAERLKALEGKDQKDDPALKARMRDLEAEQRKLREQLQQLAEDIEERAQALPDTDPQLSELKRSALDFAKGLRDSGAGEAMADAEQGLSDFSGTRGHAGAKKAADLLEKLAGKAQEMGMGGAGGRSLQSQPGFGNLLGQTMQQLLEGMGMQPGMGTGSDKGFTSSRDTMQNVGLYGQVPQKETASSGGGKKDNKDSKGGSTKAVKPQSGSEGDSGYDAGQSGLASGTGEVPVPLRYRQRNSRYFQRLADELRDR